MLSQRKIGPVVACLVCLLLGGGIWLAVRKPVPEAQLPALTDHSQLPAVFDVALRRAHTTAVNSPDDVAAVEKLAHLYQANRFFPEARACFQVLKARRPGGLSARDHYLLADIDQNEGDLIGAQTELRDTLKLDPSYLPARTALSEALFKSGHEDEAAHEYQAILDREANNPRAAIGLARIDLQRGNDAQAVKRLDELVAAHPESTAAAALLAQIFDRQGLVERAAAMRERSRQSPEAAPRDPWLDGLFADCYDTQRLSITFEEYYKTGRMDEAQPLLDRLSELDPKSPITAMFVGVTHAHGLQHVTAVREYYEALGKGGDPEKLAPLLVASLLAMGKGDEAGKLMADFYAKMPDSMPIVTAYATVAVQQGDASLSRLLLRKVLQKEPYRYTENIALAKIDWAAGEQTEAVACLLRVAEIFSADVPSRGLLGEYYLGTGRPLGAIAPLEQALAHVSADSPVRGHLVELLESAYLQTASAAMEQGKFVEALAHSEQAIALVPADLAAYSVKANAGVQLQRWEAATDALQKMISLQPDNPTFYLTLGDVLYQAGAADRAHPAWQKAFDLTPVADRDLRQALEARLAGRISANTFK